MTRYPKPRPSKRAREAAFAAQAPHAEPGIAAGGRIRWCSHALRILDGRGETAATFTIGEDGRVARLLSDGTSVPVLGPGYRPIYSPPLRTAANAEVLLDRIREADVRHCAGGEDAR